MDTPESLREQQTIWEERAREKGSSLGSVLFRRMPECVNAYIHARHSDVILERFLPRVREYGRLLDLGCGYGRLSRIVHATRPDLKLIGVDFCHTFCQLYSAGTSSPAVCADVARLPFQVASFDALLSVTSLMYVPRAQRNEAMASLIKLLRPGGTALFIEPGEE